MRKDTTQRLRAGARALVRDIPTLLALSFIVVIIVASLLADVVAPYELANQNLQGRNIPPFGRAPSGEVHLLGTDGLGRDVLSRILYAGRVSLLVGFSGVLVSGLFGSAIGIVAGYRRGRIETMLMRLVDLQMSVPFLLLAMVVLFVIGSGTVNVVAVLAIARWPVYARVSRSLVLDLGSAPFVELSRLQGASASQVMRKHIVPNVLSPLSVIGTLEMARVILAESTLSFLGLGVQAPTTSWGLMVSQGRDALSSAPWNVYIPGAMIFVVCLSFTFLVGWIRNMTDPLLRMRWLHRPPSSRNGDDGNIAADTAVAAGSPTV